MLDASGLSEAWTKYKSDGCQESRERLILHYHDRMVRPIALKMSTQLSSAVEPGDLISYGTFGLIDAIARFEPQRGIKFETYATSRIRGAIFDELRSLDWVPRGVRSRMRDLERAYEKLESELGRTPEDHEIASELGVSLSQMSQVHVVSLTTLESDEGSDRTALYDYIPDERSCPESSLIAQDIMERVALAVDSLGERDKTIIALYYLEQMTLGDIGGVLGVTESRVCQLHGSVLRDLREALIAA